MKHHVVIALAVIAWALAGMQMEARGQSRGGQSEGLVLVNVDFAGGNALEYIEALRAAGGDVNIVVDSPQAVAGVPMAAVKLASVNLNAALDLLKNRDGQSPDGRNVMLVVRIREPDRAERKGHFGNPLYQVSCEFYGSANDDSVEEISGVWTVADLLASQMESSDMLTAIETALDLFSDGAKPPEMRFHEPTGLLIARGEVEQLEVIDNIIEELRHTIALRRKAAEFSIDGFIDLALPSLREFEEMIRKYGTATSVEKLGMGLLGTDDFERIGNQVSRERERLFDRLNERMANFKVLLTEVMGKERVDKAFSKRKTE